MLFHQPEGKACLHHFVQTHMTKGLLNHFHRSQGVVLHLEQGNFELLGPVEQLGQRVSSARENQALG